MTNKRNYIFTKTGTNKDEMKNILNAMNTLCQSLTISRMIAVNS